jgi:hypothetical protein
MKVAFVIFKKLPKVNNHPLGEFSPNLVTLIGSCPLYKLNLLVCHEQISVIGRKKLEKIFD